jgi:hypothetical protein
MPTAVGRRRAGLGSVLVLAVGCGVLAGCGSGQSAVPTALTMPTLSPAASAFFDQYAQVKAQLIATPEVAARAEQRRAEREQRALATCMSPKGFTYTPALVALRVEPHPYEPSWWAAPDPATVERGMGYAPAAPAEEPATVNSAYEALSDAQKGAYDLALDDCSAAALPATGGGANPAAIDLLYQLDDALADAAGGPAFDTVASRYATCMDAAGIDVTRPSELYDLAESRVMAMFVSLDETSAEYAQARPDAVAAEVELGSADATCRAQDADAIAAALAPTLRSWIDGHRDAIRKAAAAWTGPESAQAGS